MPDKATGKAMSDVVLGEPQARKMLTTNRDNRVATQFVQSESVIFTEAGDTTYTGIVKLPPNAYLLDVIIHAVVLWDDGTSAALVVGDSDPNGIYASVNLKATDLLADEAISFSHTGGEEGADLDGGESAGDHTRRRFSAVGRTIQGVITTGGQNGSAGITHMVVIWVVPAVGATPIAVA